MKDAIRHLDKRFSALRPFARTLRPPKGWLRAVRDALGMTTSQFARRLGVSQPRVIELEKSEISGTVTLKTLQRAAEALDCTFVYALIPARPLEEVIRERANAVAAAQLDAVQHTMRLEDQGVTSRQARRELLAQRIDELLRRPARLWDET